MERNERKEWSEGKKWRKNDENMGVRIEGMMEIRYKEE